MRLTAALLTTAAALLLPAPVAWATPAPSPSPSAEAPADPCAPVDGEVPALCQSGAAPEQPDGPAAELPLTGRDDAPLQAAGAGLVLLGGGLLVAARRRTA